MKIIAPFPFFILKYYLNRLFPSLLPFILQNLKQLIMKKMIWVGFAAMAVSCNNGDTASTGTHKETSGSTGATPAAAMNYPYTIEHPDYWAIGSTANTMTALTALKAWELGKMDESVKYFSDSVKLNFDGLKETMSRDSLKRFFTGIWKDFKTVDIKMSDWESVVSSDKKEEWVTIWYTQHWETPKGLKDSLDIVNDFQMKDGKIIRLDEYTRKLH